MTPLYTIFEQHLFNFLDPEAGQEEFIKTVVKDYLKHLRALGLAVPMEWEAQVFEELFFQVQTMLVKKIYGCQNLNEYTDKIPTKAKRQAKARYLKLERAAKAQQSKKTRTAA